MATVSNFTLSATRFTATQATGVAPHTITSTTLVANLNADLLDGQEGAYYLDAGNLTGTVATARIAGSYTGITGVGTLTVGTWNATAVGTVYGGTGLTSYALGDLPYASAADTLAKLTGNTTTAKQFLSQTGDGVDSAAPAWASLATSDILSGTFADARVAESNVTQHEAALSVGFGQITSTPTTLSGYGITDALNLSGGTLTGGLTGTTITLSGSAAVATHIELSDASTPSNPASTKARIFWDDTGGSVKAVTDDGTVISLGAIGGALTDAYASLAGDTGTASASGGAQMSIVGAGGITTAAADGTPDTLTVTLDSVAIAKITATGTADATTFLRGDGAWAAAGVTPTDPNLTMAPSFFSF